MIPIEHREVFEVVALQSWDDARERCGVSLRWLEAHGYIVRNRAHPRSSRRSKFHPLGMPARLTAKGRAAARALGLDFVSLIAAMPEVA